MYICRYKIRLEVHCIGRVTIAGPQHSESGVREEDVKDDAKGEDQLEVGEEEGQHGLHHLCIHNQTNG